MFTISEYVLFVIMIIQLVVATLALITVWLATQATKRSAGAAEELVGVTKTYVEKTQQMVEVARDQLNHAHEVAQNDRKRRISLLCAEIQSNLDHCDAVASDPYALPRFVRTAWDSLSGDLYFENEGILGNASAAYAKMQVANTYVDRSSSAQNERQRDGFGIEAMNLVGDVRPLLTDVLRNLKSELSKLSQNG